MANSKDVLQATELSLVVKSGIIIQRTWIVVCDSRVFFFEHNDAQKVGSLVIFETEDFTIEVEEDVVSRGKLLQNK